MSLVWPPAPASPVLDRPGLHALVIGVAHYPHLPGGGGAPALNPLGLGQVSTPAHTASAVADWLAGRYANPAAPLASIELLLSSPGTSAERATMANIERAIGAWMQRASTHPANVALLYFCGHGLARDDQFLLPEDFGDPAFPSAWRNCINFDSLRVGLRTACRAETQVLFVDACRETPFGMLTHVNVEGRAIVDAQRFGRVARCQAIYYAATEGKQAYGPSDGVSFFGRAVIDCLEGLATTNPRGQWVVDTHAMSASLGRVMTHMAEVHRQPLQSEQRVMGPSAVLHHPPGPRVIASIGCSSDQATSVAEIELRRGGIAHRAGPADRKPLVASVEPGEWEVEVRFPQGGFRPSGPLPCTLIPPLFEGVSHP